MASDRFETDGVVLRSVPHGEADLILTLFTRVLGKVSALARGARRSRKRFPGGLGLLVVSRYQLREGRGEMWTVESAAQIESHAELAFDVACVAHASYGIELLRELTPAEHPEPEALDLLLELFAALGTHGAQSRTLRAFELGLLGALGIAPVLAGCVGCGVGDDVLDAGGAVFDPDRGGIVCGACAAAARGAALRPISSAARRLLLACQQASLREVAAVATELGDSDAAAEARDAMLATVATHLGRPLRTLEFIAKVSGANRLRAIRK